MTRALRIAGAQMPNVVGDIKGNLARALEAMQRAEDAGADVLVLPELALTGYPVEDLVLHREFIAEADAAVTSLARQSGPLVTLAGTVQTVPPRRSWDSAERSVAISQVLVTGGERRGVYHKVLLPTHSGYAEGRNMAPGDKPDALWRIGDVVAGVCICEDLWPGDGPPELQSAAGAQIILAPNASPWHREKPAGRQEMAASVARRNGLPVVYVNLVGGQDELIFDGGSLVLDADGDVLHRAAEFAEDHFVVDVPVAAPRPLTKRPATVHTRPLSRSAPEPSPTPAATGEAHKQIMQALVMGTRDYARGNGFATAMLGLSGGIDAAVTAMVAAEALGPDNVLGVALPAHDSPPEEQADAEELAANLGIRFTVVPLDAVEGCLRQAVAALPATEDDDGEAATAESDDYAAWHRHALTRSAMLTTMAHTRGDLLLVTGNKTELSIGDLTLQTTMSGHFAPLKDCPKTLLYELAERRNAAEDQPVVPERILTKPTTAQQAGWKPAQPYAVLDRIVERYIEYGHGLQDLIAQGFEASVALEVLRRIDRGELQRRAIPLGVKVTARAFGHDRRMPITNAWEAHRRADAAEAVATRVRVEPEMPADSAEGDGHVAYPGEAAGELDTIGAER